MPRAEHSPAAPDPEGPVKTQYTRLYAQLCMQAQHKYFSGKTLSGREKLYEQVVHADGMIIPATAEDPFLRFAKTQRLPDSLAPCKCMQVSGCGCLSPSRGGMANFNAMRVAAEDRQHRSRLMGMTAWQRHVHFIQTSQQFYGGGSAKDVTAGEQPNPTVKTDQDILRENYRFIREDADNAPGGWEVEVARKYYAKLFREYCIADLSRYKDGNVGLRWRTEKEVVAGKGHFVCGARGCDVRQGLASFEVQFAYAEAGVQKAALVKLRVCPKHALQLNYQKNQEALKAQERRRQKEERRAAKKRKSDGGSSKKRKRTRSKSPSLPGSPSPEATPANADAQRQKTATDAGQPAQGGTDTDTDAVFAGLFE